MGKGVWHKGVWYRGGQIGGCGRGWNRHKGGATEQLCLAPSLSYHEGTWH